MIYDSTNVLDSSIYLKAKLAKNMVGENYYIENLQNKRDADWEYRYNVVGIEEELEKQLEYTKERPMYTPIDVVVDHVKSDTGDDVSEDYLKLAFRDLSHPVNEGTRYRFSTDFLDMTKLMEDEKHYTSSIWITTNLSKVKTGNSVMVQRCNTALPLLGSPTGSLEDITEVHMEPVILIRNSQRFP